MLGCAISLFSNRLLSYSSGKSAITLRPHRPEEIVLSELKVLTFGDLAVYNFGVSLRFTLYLNGYVPFLVVAGTACQRALLRDWRGVMNSFALSTGKSSIVRSILASALLFSTLIGVVPAQTGTPVTDPAEAGVEVAGEATQPPTLDSSAIDDPMAVSAQDCIVRDNFDRADGTNMGANWTEISGDFSISGNRAVGTTNSQMSFNGNTTGERACVDVHSAGTTPAKIGMVQLKFTNASDNLAVFVQSFNGDAPFDRIFFVRDSGFSYNGACASQVLSSTFTSGRLIAYLDGTTLKADIDTNFDGTVDQSYQCSGAPLRNGTKTGLYTQGPYYWTTNSAWAGTCRTFSMTLSDGSTKTLNFSFYAAPGSSAVPSKGNGRGRVDMLEP